MALTLQTRKKKTRRDLVSLGELLVDSATTVISPEYAELRKKAVSNLDWMVPEGKTEIIDILGLTGVGQ